MPRDPKRRSRRSLPSAIERNLSLHELLDDDDKRRAARRAKKQQKQETELQQLNAYFAMIDQTELKVEGKSIAAPSDGSGDDAALSDSELVRPTQSARSRTQRTLRARNTQEKEIHTEYGLYREATQSVGKPLPIGEFVRTIEPQVKSGMYEGIFDICTA